MATKKMPDPSKPKVDLRRATADIGGVSDRPGRLAARLEAAFPAKAGLEPTAQLGPTGTRVLPTMGPEGRPQAEDIYRRLVKHGRGVQSPAGPTVRAGTNRIERSRNKAVDLIKKLGGEAEFDQPAGAAAKRVESAIPRAAGRRARMELTDEMVNELRRIAIASEKSAAKQGAKTVGKAVGKAALKGAGVVAGLALEAAFPNEAMAGEADWQSTMADAEGKLPPAYFIDPSMMTDIDRETIRPWVEQPEYAAAWDKVNDLMMDDPQFHPSEIATQAMWAEAGDPAAQQWLSENLGVVPTMEEAYGLMNFHGIASREEIAAENQRAALGLYGPDIPEEE